MKAEYTSNNSLPQRVNGGRVFWLCFCAGDILLRREGADGAFSLPMGDEPPVALQPWNHVTTLTTQLSSCNLHIVRLDKPVTDIDGLQMVGLRKSYSLLSSEDYQLAGKAAELLYWDANTKYCGVCGSPTKWMTDISKKCPECGKEWWPSVSTAIIVRILKKPSSTALQEETESSILLVRAHNFRTNHYGLVAGFVETGESLEEAVRREVREETGLEINNIRYFDSQPWPYPFGMMVGFTADYVSGEINLQKEELTDGGWFTRNNLPPIPDKASIARRLIDDWLNS